MNVEWTLFRRRTRADWMVGDLNAAGRLRCYTLEDELRQRKIMGETAVDAGRYEVVREFSPKFGRELLTLKGVPNFDYIRIHSVRDDDDTEGCIGVGNKVNEETGQISGGLNAGIEDALEEAWEQEAALGNRVFLNIYNAPGDRYVDSGELAGGALA